MGIHLVHAYQTIHVHVQQVLYLQRRYSLRLTLFTGSLPFGISWDHTLNSYYQVLLGPASRTSLEHSNNIFIYH